jgi:hypothetical protein
MKYSLSIVGLSLGFLLNSCNMISQKHFNAYKKEPFDLNSAQLRIDGIYFMKPCRDYVDHEPPHFFFFFSDGSLAESTGSGISIVPDVHFWDNPDKYLKGLHLKFGYKGHYFVRGKEIFMQFFDINPGAFFAVNALELRGTIVNDSSIVLTKGYCEWCLGTYLNYNKDGTVEFDQVEYRFYKTNIRPDSLDMWFKKKKWYKRNVWNKK